MQLREALGMASSAIWAHKLRSFLTLLGIIFGVATVILVVTLVEGFNAYFDEKIADMGSNAFVVTRYGIITSVNEFKEKEKRNKPLTMREVEYILSTKRNIADASAMSRRRGTLKAGTKELKEVRIAGVSASQINVDKLTVAEGHFFQRQDEVSNAAVAFIGKDVVKELFPSGNPLGQQIKVDGRPFTVVGIAGEIGSVFGQSQDKFIFIPITTYLKMNGSQSPISLKVSAVSSDRIPDAVEEVRQRLRAIRHIDYNAPDSFDIITPDSAKGFRDQIVGMISKVAIGVTSIALVVGGIVIMNIMLVSVTERTREIGVRKSLGARRGDILQQFLAESVLLSVAGGAIGVVIAYGLGKLVTVLMSFPTALPVGWTITALVVSASIGVFFGIYPAWRAAKLDPITALRAD
jgi:putative ABC transport system permease protein